jgi:hypothetical protein
MDENIDRLYDLLPAVYRSRDTEQGLPLKALLRVIAEQVNIVEADIAQLYENWFIETCQEWVVPYIGDLISYQTVNGTGEPGTGTISQQQQRSRMLIPRRDVANTIHQRRRKGTLVLLEELANEVANWPAHAMEFFKLLTWMQNINNLRLNRGQTLSLRNADALDRLNGPFDELAHTVDVRRIVSHRTPGRYNIPSIGLFVWRLKAYPVTKTPADNVQEFGERFYTFSILGNDSHLYTNPKSQLDAPGTPSDELHVPTPIRLRAFKERKTDYYGDGKSVQIWINTAPRRRGSQQERISRQPDPSLPPVAPDKVIVADLSQWQQYQLARDQVAVDPVYGRIAFPEDHVPVDVWVSYYYAFSADIGGGEYYRPLSQPADATLYRVGGLEQMKSINAALDQWQNEDPKPKHVVIEITDSGVYTEPLDIELEEDERLQIRAANYKRPVIRQEDWEPDRSENVTITGKARSRFTLDGLLVAGRGLKIEGNLADVCIRHCTLVPGWGIREDCQPRLRNKQSLFDMPSLSLFNTSAVLTIQHSIIGSTKVDQDYEIMGEYGQGNQDVVPEPICMHISDSIMDATNPDYNVLSSPDTAVAPVLLNIARSTVLGKIQVHVIELAENCIFNGQITVARRQTGCMRFCYVTLPSRTPRRYNCQPDLVIQAVDEDETIAIEDKPTAKVIESNRVRPLFNSIRYGMPSYCQLAQACAEEITRGADDESEMGVFHDLFQPQRAANLRARLDDYTPAGMDAGIIYAS